MEIQLREEGPVTVVAPHEKLDTGTAPIAEQALGALVDGGARKIVVDLAKVAYVSSAGLRILLMTAKRLRVVGGELRVSELNDTVREVFDISGFSTLLPVFSTTADAVRDF